MVSVIVTTKNSEADIARLLESIRGQRYRDLEIIVVDNNSKDSTVQIARSFTKKVYRYGPERSEQRNYGVRKSKGKYALILDADMELTEEVIGSCVKLAEKSKCAAVVIPEKTIGRGFIQSVRRFEREMYEGDSDVEAARFFVKKIFLEFRGYDPKLTGPEDYELPYRISKKYKIGRVSTYLLHHEENLSLAKLLRKKHYYARNSAIYAKKHPELIKTQGNFLFRKAYAKNWRKFVAYPHMTLAFYTVKSLETLFAVAGYIRAVGVVQFGRDVARLV